MKTTRGIRYYYLVAKEVRINGFGSYIIRDHGDHLAADPISKSRLQLNPLRDRHEQRVRPKRRLATNNGHMIGERHKNGSMTLEVMEEGTRCLAESW